MMDDSKRSEKLNAARKLLKEHQKKSKKTNDSLQSDSEKCASVTHMLETNDGGAVVRDTDNSSIQSLPNLTPDNETCSIPSSKGSYTNVSSFFHQDTPSEPQHFFDQIPQNTNHARFSQSNGFNTTPPYGPGESFVSNQPQMPVVNGQTYTDSANYHQYFNLYNDALQKIQWYEQQLEASKSTGDRLNQAVSDLQEKMQFQCRSIEMALTEKSDLQRQVDALQEENKAKNASCEELMNRLKASRNHVSRLEKELSDIQEARTQHNSILKKLETSVQDNKLVADRYRTELDEAKQEIGELKKSLDSAGTDHSTLEKRLAEKESQLSLALIKIQQLGVESPQSIVSQSAQAQVDMEMLNQRIDELVKENQVSSQQYQEYINNLNVQLQETTAMYESAVLVKEEQMQRISSLVEHVSDLEKQIQKHTSTAAPSASDLMEQNNQLTKQLETSNSKISEMKASFQTALAQEKAKLEEVTSQLTEARNEIGLLEDRLERLSGEVPDAKLLQAAMESDKVAAARAISQNTQLKQQLQELQEAYIKLQNTKLELTEQMEQLNHQCAGLQEELQRYIKKELQVSSSQENSTEMNQVSLIDGCCQTTYYDLEAHKAGQSEMVTPEAAAMLEDKFRTTMNRLAQVLDEKQNLEHLVTKLQSETETIGEYVALYQMQRCKLEKRELEKDQIVAAISKEKEELRDKLAEITALIPSLVNRTPHVSVGEEATEEVKEVGGENTNEAATKIMSLLSEIGTSNLVSDHSEEACISTFHPCALCSGSLITV